MVCIPMGKWFFGGVGMSRLSRYKSLMHRAKMASRQRARRGMAYVVTVAERLWSKRSNGRNRPPSQGCSERHCKSPPDGWFGLLKTVQPFLRGTITFREACSHRISTGNKGPG